MKTAQVNVALKGVESTKLKMENKINDVWKRTLNNHVM